MPEVVCLVEAKNILGEGPIWNPDEAVLYWCDNLKPSIQRYDPTSGKVDVWDMPEEVGSIVFRAKGGIVAGMRHGFAFLDLATGGIERIVDPEPHTNNRLNDGKCDRAGRYWCGSINPELKQPTGGLYRLDPDLSCHSMQQGVIASNGIAFSPDDRTMYFADSRADTVWAYDFNIATGALSNRRVFIDTHGIPARVDGATVDSEGYYWCAHIHDWSISRYSPKGDMVSTIRLPVRHPTMCTFGGDNLDVLFVTSTRKFLEPGEAESQPLAGGLFVIRDVGVHGLPEPKFGG